MGKTREIKKRIKAVGNIRRITKTMQMIATSKFAASNARTMASKPYTTTLFGLVSELAGSMADASHPLIDNGKPRPGAEVTLILVSDRGLCGPYNGSVLRAAMNFFKATPAAKAGQVELVGKKGVAFFKFNGMPIAAQHTQFTDKPSYEAVESLAQSYIDQFAAGKISCVRVVSMRFISAGRQVTQVQQILPFKPVAKSAEASAKPGTTAQYEFSPDAQGLLDDLLPAAVKATLFQLFQEANVSEHVARMIAMKAATDNSGKMGKRLTRVYNRARQAQITTELTEIISGAAALA